MRDLAVSFGVRLEAMRVAKIVRLLREGSAPLRVQLQVQAAKPRDGHNVQELRGTTTGGLRTALRLLEQIPGEIGEQAGRILVMASITSRPDEEAPSAYAESNEISQLNANIEALSRACKIALSALAPLAPEEAELIAITAPPDVTDLASLGKFVELMREGIEQPIRLVLGEGVRVTGVDRGSIVVELAQHAAAGLNTDLVAEVAAIGTGVLTFTQQLIKLCQGAFLAERKAEDAQAVIKQYGPLPPGAEQTVKEGLKKDLRAKVAELDRSFAKNHPTDHSPEVIGKLVHSVELLLAFYKRGGRIELITASETEADSETDEVRSLFEREIQKLLTAKAPE